ncbi:lysine N(6)-hydroxylase/L-ornithine N(5)-oxygenase family protein [Streptomyces sp. GbtcB6]|uniref:lysine N(6)-hydroxylase/L-ornithine N(5)-oxygenase family protein n=1 Tax=Streptomyces sp. GbtcB6 TaxID=2824751 RepID=UPI001C30BE80|nr:SidA/IucD/PvdA family monooxygenase [Streptomyces sp. GbtcB6]
MTGRSADNTDTVDILGIGFGPANLALAIAMREGTASPGSAAPLSAHFYEKKPEFGWHREMLIEDATMQVSFLKDLATVRNPMSPFTFVSYLHTRGRLLDFMNNKSFFPLRVEFHDYLEWAAEKFADQVDYGSSVVGMSPVADPDGITRCIDVEVLRNGMRRTHRARHVVLATGLEPVLPPGVGRSPRTWHSSELLRRIEGMPSDKPQRFVVVGAGQSAAEVAGHLHERFADAQVHAVLSRYGYSVADDSAFANQVFDPTAVDHYFEATPEIKQLFFEYHANTNYSVVDLDLIQDLYRRVYREGVMGRRRLHVHSVSRLRGVPEANADAVQVEIEFLPTSEVTALTADAVVYATGYRAGDPLALLGPLGSSCKRDEQGRLQVGRDYRVATEETLKAGIYLQGPSTEHTHGLSSGLLSNIAVRAGEIADALEASLTAERHRSTEELRAHESAMRR